MVMNRVRVDWAGLSGLPGVSNFYLDPGFADASPIRTFFDAIKAFFPSGLTWQVQPSGDKIDETTGSIVGGWTGPNQTVVNATGSGVYAAPVGGIVRWDTGTVFQGRRPRGRTFLVPLLSTSYDTVGTLSGTVLTGTQAAASALVVATTLKVWHRKNAKGAGAAFSVTSALVPDKAYVLRRRRD